MSSSIIPSIFYEAKRKLRDLSLRYKTIYTCKYDCVLYWKEFADLQYYPTCGEARYKNHYLTFESTTQPSLTPRRCAQSRLLKLEHYVHANGRIPMSIAPGAKKPIFPYTIQFTQAIGVCCFFVLVFNDQAMNRFVEHQMLSTIKEFRGNYHKNFKKYIDPEEAGGNPPHILVGRLEDWYFLHDHYMVVHSRSYHRSTRLLDRKNLTIKAAGQSRFYNDNTSSLSKEVSRSTLWSCFDKHTFEKGLLYRSSERIRIIKCSNSSLNLPQMVLNHSLGTRYAKLCWVDDWATQNALVGELSPSPTRWLVRALPRLRVRNPR
ncbi:CACTA en-spm transposon protein [Cucumis melo var. makuwa]|uniref:CACTA en-spm transposon protein n=1 Tax=Cucumis melo var. makuwa TaxID=1194695 RepID=A0A5D3DYW8_CUCMM|nr:CACTA en-spm transposon protein [Cucumis melo var. makuwa]